MLNLTPLQILGIIVVINGALIGGTAQLTDIVGPQVAHIVVSVCSLGNSILGGLVTVFSGQGAQVRNVLAMPGVEHIDVNSSASPVLATIAVDPQQNKINPTPAAEARVTQTAKDAAA
jgi:hypothetical protein